MKMMIYGFAAVLIIAVASDLVLDQIGFSSEERFSGAATRLNGSNE